MFVKTCLKKDTCIDRLLNQLNIYRYSKEKYLKTCNMDALNYCYPTILDMTGFQNTDDENVRETLEMILEGRVKDGTKLNSKGRSQR